MPADQTGAVESCRDMGGQEGANRAEEEGGSALVEKTGIKC